MILTSIILGAVITAAAVGIVATFWNDFLDFLKKTVARIKEVVKGILYGSKVFIRKLAEGVKEITRHYSRVEDHWEETTVTRTVPASEVPDDILARAGYNKDLDVTDEMEMKLETA